MAKKIIKPFQDFRLFAWRLHVIYFSLHERSKSNYVIMGMEFRRKSKTPCKVLVEVLARTVAHVRLKQNSMKYST